MARVLYLTHPQVKIDPVVPVPRWGLSDLGRSRAEQAARAQWMRRVVRIVASSETKAIETARILAAPSCLEIETRERMGENDRSATGFLAPPEFEVMADRFFAHPHESARGWERAADAQARIVSEVDAVLAARADDGDLLLVGHGAVGTLLICRLLGVPISRVHDQKGGGGNVAAFERASRQLIHAWRPLEASNIGEP